MNDLLKLADRCEKAAIPDRELDCLIHCAIKGWTVVYEGMNVFAEKYGRSEEGSGR